jgi:peptide/nickel transport system substrate-binding protein
VGALFEELNSTFNLDKRIDLIKQTEQLMMEYTCCIYFCYPLMNFVTRPV